MSDQQNAMQEVVDDLLTDPDKDADGATPPKPPQTIADEPTSAADAPSGDGGRYAPTGRSEDGGR